MKDKIAFAIATWFGCGYMPAARGTWGALLLPCRFFGSCIRTVRPELPPPNRPSPSAIRFINSPVPDRSRPGLKMNVPPAPRL